MSKLSVNLRDGRHAEAWAIFLQAALLAFPSCAYEVSDADVEVLEQALDGEEVIEVMSCSPGYLQLGEGSSMVCIADPSWSDPSGGSQGSDSGDEFGGGGVRGKPSPRPKPAPAPRLRPNERTCKPADLQSPAASECVRKNADDLMNNNLLIHRVICYRNGTKECCSEPNPNYPVPGVVGGCDPID